MRKDRTRVRPLIEYRHWIELDSLTYIQYILPVAIESLLTQSL